MFRLTTHTPTDVIGIIKSKEEISRIPNKQVKVKFVITDGR